MRTKKTELEKAEALAKFLASGRKLPPAMSFAERMTRQHLKSDAVLKFLASGEVFTSTDVVAALLQVSQRRAASCLQSLVEAGALKSELHSVNIKLSIPPRSAAAGIASLFDEKALKSKTHAATLRRLISLLDAGARKSETHPVRARSLKIYGITPHGLAMADAYDAPAFELGRTNPSWINHRLAGQRMRINAEAMGWTDWTPERALRLQKLRKIPDAVSVNPAGQRIAIEVENHCKSVKRNAELIVAYLQEIKSGKYIEVHFVCPPGVERLIQNSFNKIQSVKVGGEIVKLEDKHFARFKFFSVDNWPEVTNG